MEIKKKKLTSKFQRGVCKLQTLFDLNKVKVFIQDNVKFDSHKHLWPHNAKIIVKKL